MDTLKRMPFRARKSVFEKLEEMVTLSSLTKAEREKYDESLKTYRDRLAELAFAQQEGMEKGMAKGIAKGRAEEKLYLARNKFVLSCRVGFAIPRN